MNWRPLAVSNSPSVALAAILALSAGGCQTFEDFPATLNAPVTAAGVAEAALLDGEAWAPLPLRERLGVDVVALHAAGDTLYAIDSANTAHAIQLETGTHRWVVNLDREPTTQPPIYVGSHHVAFVARDHLTVVNKVTGTTLLRRSMGFSPSSGVALSVDTLYAGAWGNGSRLRSVSLADAWNGWFFTTDAPVRSTPVLSGSGADQLLVFASQDQRVIALPPRPATGATPREVVWQSQTLGRNTAALVADDDTVFVASEDHALYALVRASGAIRWKWLDANVPLLDAPVVTDDAVYQPFAEAVAAIDKAEGTTRYVVPGAKTFVGRVGPRDYFLLHDGLLAAVDAASGEELAVVTSPLLRHVAVVTNGGILAFSDGRTIFAIR